jgi:hypothetical protein
MAVPPIRGRSNALLPKLVDVELFEDEPTTSKAAPAEGSHWADGTRASAATARNRSLAALNSG